MVVFVFVCGGSWMLAIKVIENVCEYLLCGPKGSPPPMCDTRPHHYCLSYGAESHRPGLTQIDWIECVGGCVGLCLRDD